MIKILLASLLLNLLSITVYAKDKFLKLQWWALLLWGASVLILTWPLLPKPARKGAKKKWLAQNRRQAILLGLILLGAGLVRFYKLPEIPILGGDEARDAGLLPEAFLRGEIKDFFGYGIYGIPNTFFILSSLPHILFPRTVWAVRFFAAFFGVLSVLLTYKLARMSFGRKVATISATLLAFYHVHIHFSRSEFLPLLDSFWAPLLILTLILAIKRNDWRSSLSFGLAIGLSLHFYQGIRAVVLLSFLYLFAHLLTRQRNNFRKRALLALFGLFMGLGPSLLAPFYHASGLFDTGNAGKLIISDNGLKKLMKILPERALRAYGATVYYPIEFHYRYGGPFFQFPLNVFFAIGVLLILSKLPKAEYNILLLWIVAVIFFNSLLPHNVNFTHRLLSLLPVLAITAALGINQAAKTVGKLSPTFISLTLLFWILHNTKLYFYDSVWKNSLYINTKVAAAAGCHARKFPATTKIYFLNSPRMGWKSIPSWEYLDEKNHTTDLEKEGFYKKVSAINREKSSKVFIALPERKNDFNFIKEFFPNCKEQTTSSDRDLLFYSYECLNLKRKTSLPPFPKSF